MAPCAVQVRIPVRSAADSETKPATYSDFMPATIPILSRPVGAPLGRCFAWRVIVARSSGGRSLTLLSQALAGQLDTVGVVDKAVEDGIGDRWIADHVVPVIDGHLAGDDGRSLLVAVLDDLQEIAPLLVVELLRAQSSYVDGRLWQAF